MVNTIKRSTQEMIDKIQQLKRRTKLKFYKKISNYYDNIFISMDKDHFAKSSQSISKLYHEVLLLMKFLQTKPQVKNINIICYDLLYTVIKNRDEKDNVEDQF